MADYEQIQYEVEDRVLTITLSRPEKLNAFTGEMLSELLDALDRDVAEHGIDAICEAGFGDRARPRRFEVAAALNRLRSLRLHA